ncbi:hypothetical protein Taro_036062, partial [Colocasia esculenta]|nr:hypothetical protein [Colocasia esculenta]
MGSLTRANMIMIMLLALHATLTPFLAISSDMSIINNYEEEGDSMELGFVRSEEEMKHLFEEWMVRYDKSYNTLQERQRRLSIFKDNLRLIDEHNRPSNNHTYTLGLNHFADLSNEEFQSTYLGFRPSNITELMSTPTIGRRQHVTRKGRDLIPDSLDWRDKGAVTPVKSQGKCASCWAFVAVATVESLNYLVTGDLITLSEQQLVDCDQGNKGCDPGYIFKAYNHIKHNGIDTDEHYPYVSGIYFFYNLVVWIFKVNVVSIDGFHLMRRHPIDEEDMKEAVAKQPSSVGIKGENPEFRFYKSGVFAGPCSGVLNHAVTLVGYGIGERREDYWLAKNSWSNGWGEDGYARIARGNPREQDG